MHQTGLRHVGTTAVVLAVVLTLLVGFVTPGLATVPTDHLSEPAAQQTTPSNETEQHEDPDEVSQQGDSQQVSAWLERRLASQVEGSVVEISQGDYDQARAVLGDEYNSRLEQYVDVAGETAGTEDDQAVETLRETRANQRDYANAMQAYRETYDAYQEARASGNTTGARAHARELESLSERVTALNESLSRDYTTITNQTGSSTERAKTTTSNTTRNITAQQETVRTETFVETRVEIETNGSAVAFDDPMAIAGRLTLENGSVVANQSMQVVVYNRTYTTTTDSSGRFEVVYRPVSLPVNATRATVQVVPQSTSPYLGSSKNVSVNVTQVSTSLEISTSQSQAEYRDTVETTVVATVGDQVVPSLPVEASLGGNTSRGITDSVGRVSLEPHVTAGIPAGSQNIRVEHAHDGRAVGRESATVPVSIASKETNLTVSATGDNETVIVQGRLETSDGTAIEAITVTVAIGDTVQSVVTGADGQYRVTVANLSAADVENASFVTVTARFDGSGTNLANSRAVTSIRLPEADSSNGFSTVEILAGVGLGIVALLFAWHWIRQEESTNDSSTDVTGTQSSAVARGEEDHSQQWLVHARAALSENDAETATIAAYASIREQLEQRADVADSLTHYEFLAACKTNIEQLDESALEAVAKAYERTTFAAHIDPEAASAAVEGAADLLASSETES